MKELVGREVWIKFDDSKDDIDGKVLKVDSSFVMLIRVGKGVNQKNQTFFVPISKIKYVLHNH